MTPPENRILDGNAREALLFANTPSYLFKKLRNDGAVQAVGLEYEAGQLMEAIKRVSPTVYESMDSAAALYGLLIALSFHDGQEVAAYFERVATSGLKWADDIARFYATQRRLQTVVTVPTVVWPASVSVVSNTQPSSSPNVVDVQIPRPKVESVGY
ncbi:hypothetical protein EV701_10973 [Chthoniobacter flavus]|nr:hypothetical protein [Chthoniobacter flavus]TCO90924.1 hypothetical protein EV701_10973 [Chthoniobacter flavus]